MFWKKNEPPPKKPWFKNVSIITPIIAAVIFSLVGVVYKGIAEELNKKVDNQTLQLMIEKDRDELKTLKQFNSKQQEAIEQNQEAIRDLLTDKKVKEALKEAGSDSKKIMDSIKAPPEKEVYITKEVFDFYIQLPPEQKENFRKLHPEYKALPPP
jgi:hypothetical protein